MTHLAESSTVSFPVLIAERFRIIEWSEYSNECSRKAPLVNENVCSRIVSNRSLAMVLKGTILVTGGAGYIASHTIIELLINNYDVIALDNLFNSYSVNKETKPECLQRVEKITGKLVIFYQVDLCDKHELTNIFECHKIDCVIHLASLKYVGESVKAPLTYYLSNIATTIILLQVMQETNVNKIIFSSSSNVYGNPEFVPVSEEHQTGKNCKNPYGKSKYFIEEMLKDVCASNSEWRVISLRYFSPSGAHKSGLIGEDPLSNHLNLIPCISQVAVGKRSHISVYGHDYNTKDGTCVRDYTHITDVAIGHLKTLEKINAVSYKGWTAYNLAAERGYTVLEVIKAFERVSKRKIKYELFERRNGDIEKIYGDATKAKNELNWSSKKDIDIICRDVWNWQLTNPNGFRGN
ncbi:hypothetical protein FQA39_LY09201 [Lamprigera yunnana]|nr:hypothetical protein FQA39_LY09201 [Lamprigera yunnana]